MSFDPVQLARESFASYIALMNPKYEFAPHIDILIQFWEMVERGEIERGMINMPPRHSKTETGSRMFPPWYFGKHPDKKILLGCHTQSLATKLGKGIRNTINRKEHQLVFPTCQLRKDSHASHEFDLTEGGEFFAAGMLTGVTGRGGDLILIDDPLKGEEARSPVQRETLHEMWDAVWRTRLQPKGQIIITNTRWHEDDLQGYLLDAERHEEIEDWQVLCMPAVADKAEGWREEGEALWAEKFPLETLLKIKRGKNQWVWSALYQQRPSAIEGVWFKRSWWREYVWNPHNVANRTLPHIDTMPYRIVQSWDTAFEEEEHNDYSVCITVLDTPKGAFILDVYRRRLTADELFKKAVELAIYWRANVVLVEKKASGHSLVQHLRANPKTKLLPVIGRIPRGKKEVRAKAIAPYVENGNFYLPAAAEWKRDFVDEVSGFPTSAHDDQVDSLSQLADYLYLDADQRERFGELDEPQGAILLYDT